MALAQEDIAFIKRHFGEWLAEQSLGQPLPARGWSSPPCGICEFRLGIVAYAVPAPAGFGARRQGGYPYRDLSLLGNGELARAAAAISECLLKATDYF